MVGILLCGVTGLVRGAPSDGTNIVEFKVSAPYSSDDEMGRRFGFRPPLPLFDITQEQFRVRVPEAYSTNSAWGLMVWLNPNDDVSLTPDWEEGLARKKIIIVMPLLGGQRHRIDRLRQALDATSNVCRRYRIDRQRIYVGGFAEGAGLASTLGIGCADIFKGTICVGGASFYLHVAAGGNLYYPSSFTPSAEILHAARRYGKYVLISGEGDPQREIVQLVAQKGFLRDGFKNVIFIDVPGMQQALPGPAVLAQALTFLDERKPQTAEAQSE
jgi:hypothetical protein